MLTFATAVQDDLAGMDFDAFQRDGLRQRAVTYSLQCISEAAVKLGAHAEEHAPEVNWAGTRGFGNVARHEYGMVNLEIVWEIVQLHLPGLIKACRRIIAELEAAPDPD